MPITNRRGSMYGIKNIEKAQVLTLKSEVAYQPGQVVSKTLAQNNALSVTLFAFDKGEEISTHESGGDAFVTCLDGVGRNDRWKRLRAARGRVHRHARAPSARGIRSGAVQNAAGRRILKRANAKKRLQSELGLQPLALSIWKGGTRQSRAPGRASSIQKGVPLPRAG